MARAWPGEDSGATGFGVQRVGRPVTVELVAGPTVQRQRDLVAHGPRGQEDGGRFAEELRHRFDQLIYARVLSELLVPDRCVADRPSHGLRRTSNSVAAQVDPDGPVAALRSEHCLHL